MHLYFFCYTFRIYKFNLLKSYKQGTPLRAQFSLIVGFGLSAAQAPARGVILLFI